jgi:hypothetical protein
MKKLLPFILVCVCGMVGYGQHPVLENNPTSIKWYQVNTPNFRVIFPKGFDEQGQRIANTLEHIREAEAKSLGASHPRKISVILQNQSSVSNGFVSVMPRRSEFYTMPSQDYNFIGTNDWLELLASHEYRHIVQYQHATRGFNKLFYYLFGSAALAGMSQVAAPQWFWEGDAVATETAFTPSGRGKIPNFGLVFRTNMLEGRKFNYHKQYLRSYKHNIPDHYVLGYHMVSYLRKRTNDPDIWGKITARSWSVPFIPFAFSNAIKKETGLHVTQLYNEMASDLQKEWKEEVEKINITPYSAIHQRKNNTYTDYLYPQPLADGTVLVMKKGIGNIEQFVILKEGKEKEVFTPGMINNTGMITSSSSTIVWNEFGFDPRWSVRNYSLIKAYDLTRKKKIVVGNRKSRYVGAALSPDKTQVVTIHTGTDYKSRLTILTFPGGKVLREFPNTENNFYSMPQWSSDGKHIVALKTTSTGKTIALIDITSGEEKNVLPHSQENVGYPVVYEHYLLHNSPVSGIDNIYAIDLRTNQRYQITRSKYGAYNPAVSVDGKTIYYNDQTRNGLDVVEVPFDPSSWTPVSDNTQDNSSYEHLVKQEGRPGLFDSIPQQTLPVRKYSKLKGIINPYSWGMVVNNDDLTRADIGIISQDLLSTVSVSAGYTHDINERTGMWRAGISYQRWFPILDLELKSGKRSVDLGSIRYDKITTGDTTSVVENLSFDWYEQMVEGGIRIPLVMTSSKFITNITVSNSLGYISVTDFKNSIDEGGRLFPTNNPQFFYANYIDRGDLFYNHFDVSAHHLLKRSRRDINSRWGQALFVDFYNTPLYNTAFKGNDHQGKQFSVYGLAYFPGLFKHHSFYSYGAYQQTQTLPVDLNTGEGLDNYTFRNEIPLPRGLSVERFQNMYSMSANYTMPVWYPDIALGPLVNFQRIRTNFFLDYGFGETSLRNRTVSRTYLSTGAEVKLDINILRFLPQFDIGFRYSYGIEPSVTRFEFLIGTFNF